jgi:hypothetical protein
VAAPFLSASREFDYQGSKEIMSCEPVSSAKDKVVSLGLVHPAWRELHESSLIQTKSAL